MLDAERLTRPFPRCIISYEDLLTDCRLPISRLTDRTPIPFPRSLTEATPDIQALLSPKLRHFQVSPSTLDADPSIVWWIKALYTTLQRATRSGLTSETELLCTHLDKLFTDAQQIYGPLIKSPKK